MSASRAPAHAEVNTTKAAEMQQGTEQQEVERTSWHNFLESVTQEYQGDEVTIEVLSREYGDQQEAERLPLVAIDYDGKDDAVIVSVGGRDGRYPVVLRHIIRQPRRILVGPPLGGGMLPLDVVAADDTQTLIAIHPRP
jgi:hypothetical protein